MYSPILTPSRGEEQTRRFPPSKRSTTDASPTIMARSFTIHMTLSIVVGLRLQWRGFRSTIHFGEVSVTVYGRRRVLPSGILADSKRRSVNRRSKLRVMVHRLRRMWALRRCLMLKWRKRGNRKRHRDLSRMRVSRRYRRHGPIGGRWWGAVGTEMPLNRRHDVRS